MKRDPKQSHLYWRGRSAYFRIRILTATGAKDHAESLGPLGLEDARRLVRDKLKASALDNYLERWGERRLRQGDWTGLCGRLLSEVFGASVLHPLAKDAPGPAGGARGLDTYLGMVQDRVLAWGLGPAGEAALQRAGALVRDSELRRCRAAPQR